MNFQDSSVKQLFADERFSPLRQKLKMLDTAQELAGIVERDQQYPFEFVCYKITGYRPESEPAPHLIDGDILISDLAFFILSMSKTISQPVQMIREPFFTLDKLADKLNVSLKTVNRWRKKGLITRSFIFEDGKRRIVVLESSLEIFLNKNKEIVERSGSFSRLDKKQKDQIIALALELAEKNPSWSRQKLIRETAAKTARAPETIRYTLLNKFSRVNSKLTASPAVITPHEAAQIYNSYSSGTRVNTLARKYQRSRSSIYRIINQHKARYIASGQIQYVASEDFTDQDKRTAIMKARPESKLNIPAADLDNLPGNIKKINDMPLLTRDQEQQLFRLYNCLKYQAAFLSDQAGGKGSVKGIGKIESLLKRADKIKNILVCSNLRLVVSIARNHINRGMGFSDLVSEGAVALMRAVEGYNYKKGFRFATYASWAITRSFAETVSQKPFSLGDDVESLHSDIRLDEAAAVPAIEQAGEDLELVISKNLNEREQYIIRNHFGLDGSLIRRNYKNMKEIGRDLGISGERVRQIELQALQKLRHCLSSEMFDSLLK
jgi:RNA polymerase sigma factor (sigma-70 family)